MWIRGAGHNTGLGDGIGGVTICPRVWGASRDMMPPLLRVEKMTSNHIQSTVNGFVSLKTEMLCLLLTRNVLFLGT